jgi:apolipoprotein N-acyltransferase
MNAHGGRREQSFAGPRRDARSRPALLLAFVLGAAAVASFAPLRLFALAPLALAVLFVLWARAAGPRAAAALGFAYGLGLFLAGVSWIYVSLHVFGAMSAPLAALATALFCAGLALFPAAAGYLFARVPATTTTRLLALAPALWTLAEWCRSWFLTGFPWLALGYSQIPESPLAGYAPVLGLHGVTLATALTAGAAAALWQRATGEERAEISAAGRAQRARILSSLVLHPACAVLLALWVAGHGLKQVAWTEPSGEPLTVSLLQGNIAQDLKWRPEQVRATLDTYRALAAAAPGRLVVLPETALPLFLEQVPSEDLEALAARVRARGGDVLVGVPERLADGSYFNSMVSFGAAPSQTYRKSHLVPFGEFIPLRPLLGWVVGVLAIPLQDFSRGAPDQRPLALAGERVAVNICYEDAFGEEIIRQLPEATLIVNASNVAWFGRSAAPAQHLQIAQARALETGRYVLRATNTGVTAVIDPRGALAAAAPQFVPAILTHVVQGRRGATPYVRFGNGPALALCLALAAAALGRPRRLRD